mgnify:FL=1
MFLVFQSGTKNRDTFLRLLQLLPLRNGEIFAVEFLLLNENDRNTVISCFEVMWLVIWIWELSSQPILFKEKFLIHPSS